MCHIYLWPHRDFVSNIFNTIMIISVPQSFVYFFSVLKVWYILDPFMETLNMVNKKKIKLMSTWKKSAGGKVTGNTTIQDLKHIIVLEWAVAVSFKCWQNVHQFIRDVTFQAYAWIEAFLFWISDFPVLFIFQPIFGHFCAIFRLSYTFQASKHFVSYIPDHLKKICIPCFVDCNYYFVYIFQEFAKWCSCYRPTVSYQTESR